MKETQPARYRIIREREIKLVTECTRQRDTKGIKKETGRQLKHRDNKN